MIEQEANRIKQATRPNHPANLWFDLSLGTRIPKDFVQANISIQDRWYFLLATTFMLSLLLSAKNWFVNGTLRAVQALFVQLFFIYTILPMITDYNYRSQIICLWTKVSVNWLGNGSFRSYSRLDPGSFLSYSLSVRSFRPGSFWPDFRGRSFRPNFGGPFQSTLFYTDF